jgi:thiosulfate/3-mercaptopyruvate sulfurtransferase
VFLDVDEDLSAPGGGRGLPAGRHPWPSEAQVARVLGAAGIGPGARVVAYDDAAGSVAARLWYVLRAHGHDEVAVLDGGLAKWTAEGRPLSTEAPRVLPVGFSGRLRPGFVIDKAGLVATYRGRLVLDARAAERYRGEAEPIDPRAGHVPGAKSAPWTGNLTADPVPVFLPPEALRRRYEGLGAGVVEPVAYCGSGVNACHDLLALHLAGLRGSLYAGSWSEWSSDPSLPLATGEA